VNHHAIRERVLFILRETGEANTACAMATAIGVGRFDVAKVCAELARARVIKSTERGGKRAYQLTGPGG